MAGTSSGSIMNSTIPDTTANEVLRFENVTLGFPGTGRLAIKDISFSVSRGKFVAIIGPSGCGKSTLLNLAAGLLKPSRGEVYFDGGRVDAVNTRAAYVTQDANLLPWLTVRSNVGLALKMRGFPAAERDALIHRWIDLVGLTGFENHYPRELSGGMQKRCAMARSLIYDPALVLMDEPFGPLDAITRLRLQQELLNLWEGDRTVVFVTHDLTEAICLADEVVVVSKGPGTVRGVIPIPIARPRNITSVLESQEFSTLYGNLWELFRSEIS
jgi:NitT/TauT family transport system ATP-binding protein